MSIETLIETYTRHIKRNEQQIVELQKEKKAAKEKKDNFEVDFIKGKILLTEGSTMALKNVIEDLQSMGD